MKFSSNTTISSLRWLQLPVLLSLAFQLPVGSAEALPIRGECKAKPDAIPRVALVSAFSGEADRFIDEMRLSDGKNKFDGCVKINGHRFTKGKLRGKNIVVVLTNISIVNASMVTQLTLDKFNITKIIFSGIAGGVGGVGANDDDSTTPNETPIGSVTIPKRWGFSQETYFNNTFEKKESGSEETGLDGRLKQAEDRLDELNERLERRRKELQQERHCTIAAIEPKGSAWVLPHPDRYAPDIASMVSDAEIEQIAINAAIAYEESQGWQVESVESENRGFDLISRKSNPDNALTTVAVKFIEVKGRSHIGQVALTTNEYRTADRLKQDYWLYVVFNCALQPEIHVIQDPAKLDWEAFVKVEHYHINAAQILEAE